MSRPSKRRRRVEHDLMRDLETGEVFEATSRITAPRNALKDIPDSDRVVDVVTPDGRTTIGTCVWLPGLDGAPRALSVTEASTVQQHAAPMWLVDENGTAYGAMGENDELGRRRFWRGGSGWAAVELFHNGQMYEVAGSALIAAAGRAAGGHTRRPRVRASIKEN